MPAIPVLPFLSEPLRTRVLCMCVCALCEGEARVRVCARVRACVRALCVHVSVHGRQRNWAFSLHRPLSARQ